MEAFKRDLVYKKYVNEVIVDGKLKDITYNIPENFNFGFDVVDELAHKIPNKKAMIWVANDKSYKTFTFKDINEYSNMTANYFISLGIKKGDKVMLVLRKHYQFWFSIIALHKIGAIVIPATHLLMAKDFVYRFNAANVKAVICSASGETAKEIDKSQDQCPTLKIKSIVDGEMEGWSNFDKEIVKFSKEFKRPIGKDANRYSDIMIMYFTSGTTGYPKIAAHDFTYAIGHITTAVWWHNVDPDGVHFTTADTGWGKAVWGKLYGQWFAESCIFVYDYEKFSAHDMLPLFAQHNITTFCAPPTIYRFLIKEDLTQFNLKSLKYATVAGEALNPEVYKQFYNATGVKLMEGFGQTETTLTVANLIGMEPKPGSMGKPYPQYHIDLIDSEGNTVKTGENGEICIKTEPKPIGLFIGYYSKDGIDKELTAKAWYNGYYHTGDVAWRDEDGYLWFVGRTDDLIKSSGYRIGPFEIESVIMEHKAVLECAVTGVPDTERGQVVKATIVLAKGYEPSEALKKEIQDFVKHATEPYKYPRVIDFVKELPKTISGKIRRVELKEGYKADK
jgi:acetyl-CoA synthetase